MKGLQTIKQHEAVTKVMMSTTETSFEAELKENDCDKKTDACSLTLRSVFGDITNSQL